MYVQFPTTRFEFYPPKDFTCFSIFAFCYKSFICRHNTSQHKTIIVPVSNSLSMPSQGTRTREEKDRYNYLRRERRRMEKEAKRLQENNRDKEAEEEERKLKEMRAKAVERKRKERARTKQLAMAVSTSDPNLPTVPTVDAEYPNSAMTDQAKRSEDQLITMSTTAPAAATAGYQLDTILHQLTATGGTNHITINLSDNRRVIDNSIVDNRVSHTEIKNIHGAAQEDVEDLKETVRKQGDILHSHEHDIGVLYTRTGRGKPDHDPRTVAEQDNDFQMNLQHMIGVAGNNCFSPTKVWQNESDNETEFFSTHGRFKDDDSDMESVTVPCRNIFVPGIEVEKKEEEQEEVPAMMAKKKECTDCAIDLTDENDVDDNMAHKNDSDFNSNMVVNPCRNSNSSTTTLSWKEIAILGEPTHVCESLKERTFDFDLYARVKELEECHPSMDFFLFGSSPFNYMGDDNEVTNCPTISVLAAPKQSMPLCRVWKPIKESQSEGTIYDFASVGLSWKCVSEGLFILDLDPSKQSDVEYCSLWKPDTTRLADGRLSIDSIPITWSVFEVDECGDVVYDDNGDCIPVLDDDGETPLVIDITWDRKTNSVQNIIDFYMSHLDVVDLPKYKKALTAIVVDQLTAKRAVMEAMIQECKMECPDFVAVELTAKFFPLGVKIDKHGHIGYVNKFYKTTENVFAAFNMLEDNPQKQEEPVMCSALVKGGHTTLREKGEHAAASNFSKTSNQSNTDNVPRSQIMEASNIEEPIAFRTRQRCRNN
jgi:hypothetical protein